MRIIGICRFSYLATRGWKRTVAEDIAATAAVLFDPARLEERFRLFEALTLPSIRAQTDEDFTFLVLAAASLPEPWAARLAGLCDAEPRISLHRLKPMPMTVAVTRALRRTVNPDGAAPVVQFCLDDDDALSVRYVERLRAFAGTVHAAGLGGGAPVALNHPRGITLSRRNGVFVAHENFAPFLALGLALMTDATIPSHPYMVPHLKTATRHVAVSDPGPLSYLRGLHDHHDSRGLSKGRTRILEPDALARHLSTEFPFITGQTLAGVFGAPPAFTTCAPSAA